MKLVFDGTYDDLIDSIVKAYRKYNMWPLVDMKKRPIVRFMHRRRGGMDRSVDTVTQNGKTVITPRRCSAYESKGGLYKELCKNLMCYLLVFFTALVILFGVWVFLFGDEMWYIPILLSVVFTYGIYRYVKRKDDALWRKLFIFLVMDVGCVPLNEGMGDFGFKHIPSDEEKEAKKQKKTDKKLNKKLRQ